MIKKLFILTLFYFQGVYGNPPLEEYFFYIQRLEGSKGDYREGEIEIVLDPTEIFAVQKVQEKRLLEKGVLPAEAEEFSRVGVVSEDQYLIWIRDAVYFPNKIAGTYDRLLRRSELQNGAPGVAILPVLPSGQVVLLLNYRHATRSWELEIPRGLMDPGETKEEAAARELKEETGLKASSMIFLGEMAVDTGILSSVVPIFFGKVLSQEKPDREYSEAIAGLMALTKEELKQGLMQGFLEVSIQGKKKQVPLRDPFLTFALLQGEMRKLL